MSDIFIDTDVIIRLLTGDDLNKQAAVRGLFKQVEDGSLTIAAPVTVIADAVHVLSSPRLYQAPRSQVAAMLSALLRLSGFHVDQKSVVLRTLEITGSTPLRFGDAFIVASMEQRGSTRLYSYDRHFDRFSGITRQEP